jgi:hypothetical protein
MIWVMYVVLINSSLGNLGIIAIDFPSKKLFNAKEMEILHSTNSGLFKDYTVVLSNCTLKETQ